MEAVTDFTKCYSEAAESKGRELTIGFCSLEAKFGIMLFKKKCPITGGCYYAVIIIINTFFCETNFVWPHSWHHQTGLGQSDPAG